MRRWVEVLTELQDCCDEPTLKQFIGAQWVCPQAEGEDWLFDDIDIERCRLIVHLRVELSVNDDAVPVILHLLDQVYGLRHQVRTLAHAIEKQPREIQADIFSRLKKSDLEDIKEIQTDV